MATREPIRYAGFLIHKLPGKRRAKPYLVDLRACQLKEGDAKRPCFATLKQAKQKCIDVADEIKEKGSAAFDLSDRDRLDAKDALAQVAGRCSLTEACRYWAKYHPDTGATTYDELLKKYRGHLEAQKVRPATLASLSRLVRVGRSLGKQPVATITSNDLAEWLDGRSFKPTNRNNYRRLLSAFFNYAVSEGIASVNPLDRVPVIRVEAAPVKFWTVEQVGLLLHTAEALKPELVPYLAILALAGLRPAEAEGLLWESVNITEKIIRVEGVTSKTRARRVVPISDNLAAWLVRFRKKTGPVAPKPQSLRRWRERITAATLVPDWQERLAKQKDMKGTDIAQAGLTWEKIITDAKEVRKKLWHADILRHSFASHWLPVHHDENKLAEIMGNSPGIIHRNYRGLVTEEEAAPYWQISPSDAGKIIQLKATA